MKSDINELALHSIFKASILDPPHHKFANKKTLVVQSRADILNALKQHKPFDYYSTKRKAEPLEALIVYPSDWISKVEGFKADIAGDEKINGFSGYNSLFHQALKFIDLPILSPELISLKRNIAEAYKAKLEEWLSTNNQVDIAIIFHEGEDKFRGKDPSTNPYFITKILMLNHGIPTQSIDINKYSHIRTSDGGKLLPFYLENISLAIYAKTGGKPWAIGRSITPSYGIKGSDLIIGVGAARSKDGRNIFASTTFFENDGTFSYWSSGKIDYMPGSEGYVDSFKRIIIRAIEEYLKDHPEKAHSVQIISFHISGKIPGKDEIKAIKKAMLEKSEFKYALFHINISHPLLIVDEERDELLPPVGLKVVLNKKDILLVTVSSFFVKPLRVLLIDENINNKEIIDQLAWEIFALTRMNWRSFKWKRTPSSINYPKLLAQIVCSFSELSSTEGSRFSEELLKTRLKGKAWFL
jgi:hypothetical protein